MISNFDRLQFHLRRRPEVGRGKPLGYEGQQESCPRSGRVSRQGHTRKANLGKNVAFKAWL